MHNIIIIKLIHLFDILNFISATKMKMIESNNKSSGRDDDVTPIFSTVSANSTINTTTPELVNISMCLCPCACTVPVSKQNSDRKMAAMLEDLRIPKFMTSYSKRKLSSAPDHRISSKSIGVVGTFVMTIVFGVIVISDVKRFLINARTAYGNLRDLYAN